MQVSRALMIARFWNGPHGRDKYVHQIRAGRMCAVIEALADSGSCATCSLHDSIRLEGLGIPSVPVATHEFATADFDAVYVEHPIQDQTPQEIAAWAETVVDEIVAQLTANQ
jgi:hypothetical protein